MGCCGECDGALPGFLRVFCSSVDVVSSHWSGVGRFVSIGQVLLQYCFVCLDVQVVWVIVYSFCFMTLLLFLLLLVCCVLSHGSCNPLHSNKIFDGKFDM